MQIPLTLAATALLVPVADDQLALQFLADQTIAQTWSISQKSEVSLAALSVMGTAQDTGSGSAKTRTAELEVIDTALEAKDGALTKFSRRFESIEAASEITGVEETESMRVKDGESTSALIGQEVIFTQDEDSEQYEAEYAEGSEGEEEWLEGLRPSACYLGGVLSDEAAAEGDSWDVPPEFMASLLDPFGDLDVQAAEDDEDDSGMPEGAVSITLPNAEGRTVWGDLEGKLKATWVETEEKDGKRIATIELAVDLTGEFDLVDVMEEEAEGRGSKDSYVSATLQRTIEGEVTIRWDLGTGLPLDLEGELEGTKRLFVEWTVSAAAELELEFSFERESSDEMELSATFEVQ